jgi:SAM-dependent methyltransferase
MLKIIKIKIIKIIKNMNVRIFLKMARRRSPKAFLRGILFYFSDLKKIRNQKKTEKNFDFPFGDPYPMLYDKFSNAGVMSGDYFNQDFCIARKIFVTNPQKHVDIGSRIDGFVAHVAVFREIEIFDIRNQESKIQNIIFKQADLMQLPEGMDNYCDSISALHSIEHFGLGRYGDPIDYFGHIKAIKNITKILKPQGIFYFSVPIGKQRIEFNAHRIFSLKYLWNLLKNDYDLISFSYVDDKGEFYENVNIEFSDKSIDTTFSTTYTWGCGIFELKKK